jgi:hypothetical protein
MSLVSAHPLRHLIHKNNQYQTMLRRRLSTSLLNAQALLQTPAARVPPVPALPAQFAGSNRGLASAMLLSSKENWSSKTVKNLKEALAQRGLSQ